MLEVANWSVSLVACVFKVRFKTAAKASVNGGVGFIAHRTTSEASSST